MIPKIIHFCWFGGNPLPELAQKCIASWRKYLPDYEIWQWSERPLHENETLRYENENNLFDRVMEFDVEMIPYTAEAYRQKKYAFVSDYARFWILYHYGGLYFDTDVEIIRPMDDIIEKGAFMGFELDPDGENSPLKYAPKYAFSVALGLGFGVERENRIMKRLLEFYKSLSFEIKELTPYTKTIVAYTTEVLQEFGLQNIKGIQEVCGITIYPSEYFAPINVVTGRLHVTENTRTIHRYMASWDEKKGKSVKDYLRHYMPEPVLMLLNKYKRNKYKLISQ